MIRELVKDIYEIDVGYPDIKRTFASYVIVGERVLIIDPGPVNFHRKLLRALEDIGVSREDEICIALTHIHPDHYGGASKIIGYFPNSTVLVHPRGTKHLVDVNYLWESAKKVLGEIAGIFGKPDPIPREKISELVDGDPIRISSDRYITPVFTPGHATHHVSYILNDERIVFLGDSGGLFINDSLAPTTPFPFNFEKAVDSIIKILSFKPKYVAYAHFGLHGSASRKLIEYMGQLYLWLRIIRESGNTDPDTILREIVKVDHETERFLTLVKENPVMSGAVMHSLHGFMKYIDYISQKK